MALNITHTSQAHFYMHLITGASHVLTGMCWYADVLGGPGIPAVHSLLAGCRECVPRSRMGVHYGGAAGTPPRILSICWYFVLQIARSASDVECDFAPISEMSCVCEAPWLLHLLAA